MPLLPGTILGPYTIVGPLGAGGMGEVYRAHDGRLGRDVAIKVLPAVVSHDPERRARLQREARAIAALNHPHICVIHDVGEQDGLDFIVMELLDGESLAARLTRGPMRFSEAAPIARTILDTLAAVHARGLLHRDLKPANIFLTQHGVKLLDFGLARSAEPDQGGETAITREGLVLGSPRYMAPEQIRGAHLDHRTDLFVDGPARVQRELAHRGRARDRVRRAGAAQAGRGAACLPTSAAAGARERSCQTPAIGTGVRGCTRRRFDDDRTA
jgi:serine/threonine protein kinase